jgi:phosphoglycerate dehydrogenase-like enzyme
MNRIYLCAKEEKIRKVYCDTGRVYTKAEVLNTPELFKNTEYVFSTWGMPAFTEDVIKTCLPNLKAIFYGAGSVQSFARPFLNCGVKVFSAWAANAVPVAEYTLAQILLANTGYFHTSILMSVGKEPESQVVRSKFPGNYGVSVGIIGVGMIGRMVIELLKDYKIHVMAYSPSLTEEKAAALGVERSTIEEIFEKCLVVSNHMADLPQTRGMLGKKLFSSMRPYATFLNTGRGAQVVEAELAEVLQERPDLVAVLDVTFPEPPLEDCPFYSIPNCILTPHIAGSIGNEVHRMSEYMTTEFQHYISGEPCEYEVTLEMLERMA